MKKFEYKCENMEAVTLKLASTEKVNDYLNKMGNEGWELIKMHYTDSDIYSKRLPRVLMIFKREQTS